MGDTRDISEGSIGLSRCGLEQYWELRIESSLEIQPL